MTDHIIPQQVNQDHDWSVDFAWLSVADTAAAAEQQRAAAFHTQHAPTPQELADGQRQLEARRRAEGLTRDRPVVPIADVARVEFQAVEYAQDTGDFNLDITTYSRIALAAMPQGLAASSRLYDILQHRARLSNGHAYFTATQAGQHAAGLGVTWHKVRDAIKPGIRIFWEVIGPDPKDRRRTIFRLMSKERVCLALGIDGPGPRIALPKIAYQGSLDDYKAHVYSAFWHGNNGSFARATLEAITGHTRQTLRQWERQTGINVTTRIIEADSPTNEAESAELERNRGDRWWYEAHGWRKGRKGRVYATRKTIGLLDTDNDPLPDYDEREARAADLQQHGQQLNHVWQDTNEYQPTQTRAAASGRSKHIKTRLQSLLVKHPNLENPPAGAQGDTAAKRYAFPRRMANRQQAAKFQSKHNTTPILFRTAQGRERLIFSTFARMIYQPDKAQHQRQLRLGPC